MTFSDIDHVQGNYDRHPYFHGLRVVKERLAPPD
jgi:hypothetical protein